MDDSDLLARIRRMVEAEHELRRSMQDSPEQREDARAQLRDLELALDQAWDLLRQRRAREEYSQDPAEAQPRPVPEVEGYVQ